MRFRSSPVFVSLAMALALMGCSGGGGGGGGGSGSTPPEVLPPPPPETDMFSITGTISASPSQSVDGDSNDPLREARPNDSISTAQTIGNPTTLGGYVNQPGTGAEGRSQTTGDSDDYFRVQLLEGQQVTLLIADFEQADADLYLADTQGNILDFSVDTGDIESVSVPSDGTYIVNVFAYAGATNYVLAIGSPNPLGSRGSHHRDIIPWQTVVSYHSRESTPATPTLELIRERLGMEQQAGGPGRANLMAVLRNGIHQGQSASRLGTAASRRSRFNDPELAARWETLQAIKSLRKQPGIASAEPNYRIRALGIPDDPAYPSQWHLPLINLPAAWDTSTGDPDVIVAVVDTGILADHPDLARQLVPGFDFVRDPSSGLDGNGIDADPEDPGSGGAPGSNSYHGSHVAGTIAATGDNGLGVAGTAYSSRLMPLRALGAGGAGTSYDVIQAIRYAAGLANDSGTRPERPATIINLSLGGGAFSASAQQLFRQLHEAGILVVAAAGNQATSQPQYPAAYDGVISVSAVDAQARLTSYSNTGPYVDIAAPGGNSGQDLNGDGYPDGVLSTSGSGAGQGLSFAYTFLSGTSMAAPHVSGVLALMKSVNPDLTPEDIDALLEAGALTDDLGAAGRDDSFGYGLVNAQSSVLAALDAMGDSPADRPLLTASARTLNFSASDAQLDIEFRNGGAGELRLISVTESEPWLQARRASVDASGLGSYRVRVSRDDLAPGIHSATITARSNVNELLIQVLVSAGDIGESPDVGVIYILLENTDSGEIIDQFAAAAQFGEYRFLFDNVPAGNYQLVAGSDSDNDLFICDPGEACGAWLTLDQPATIELTGTREDLDFPIEYLVSLPDSTSSLPSSSLPESPAKTVAKKRVRVDH